MDLSCAFWRRSILFLLSNPKERKAWIEVLHLDSISLEFRSFFSSIHSTDFGRRKNHPSKHVVSYSILSAKGFWFESVSTWSYVFSNSPTNRKVVSEGHSNHPINTSLLEIFFSGIHHLCTHCMFCESNRWQNSTTLRAIACVKG